MSFCIDMHICVCMFICLLSPAIYPLFNCAISFFQIESISGTLVLRWVNSQLARILGWVERAIQQEVCVAFLDLF